MAMYQEIYQSDIVTSYLNIDQSENNILQW